MTRVRRLIEIIGAIAAGVAGLTASMCSGLADEVLVVSQTAAELAVLDTKTDTISYRIKLDAAPAGVAVSPSGHQAYITHPEIRQLSVVDLVSRTVIAKWPVGRQPFAVAVDGRGGVWVGDWSADVVQRINVETGSVMRSIAVGRSPSAILMGVSDTYLYTVNRESDDVSIADPVSGQELRRVAVGRGPFAIAGTSDRTQIFVVNVQASTVSVVDPQTFKSVFQVRVGRMPYGIAIDERTGRVLVTNQQSGSVTVFDAKDGRVLSTIPVGKFPEGVVVAPGSGKAYVANWFSNQVSVINVADGKETGRVTCGAGPRMLAVRPDSSS
jgi:YVTN family beta-propeller protein